MALVRSMSLRVPVFSRLQLALLVAENGYCYRFADFVRLQSGGKILGILDGLPIDRHDDIPEIDIRLIAPGTS